MSKRACALLIAAAIGMGPASAQSAGDGRVQSILYVPGAVVTLSVAMGYATVVELANEDRIETVVVGNSAAWQVSSSKRGDQLVIKPLAVAVPTNLIVTTGARQYVFLLQSGEAPGSGPFVLRFIDQHAMSDESSSTKAVADYRFRGDKDLLPIAMTDNGQRTRITWAADIALPATFSVDDHGKEALVNGRMVGSDYVIDRIAPRFVFRRDKAHAEAVRRPIQAAH